MQNSLLKRYYLPSTWPSGSVPSSRPMTMVVDKYFRPIGEDTNFRNILLVILNEISIFIEIKKSFDSIKQSYI